MVEKRAFVTGHPIAHSRSPKIHRYWLEEYGIDGSYQAIDVRPEDFAAFLKSLGENGYRGGNVTIPHKEAAFALVERRDEAAEAIGAVNTLWLEDGVLWGGNTDALGFAGNLDEHAPGWAANGPAVVLGAGGASRAVIQALKDRGLNDIRIVNRTLARAEELADRFGAGVSAHGAGAVGELLSDAGLLVNTTALGMHGNEILAADPAGLPGHAIVTDIVYVPLETPLLAAARARGLKTVDGLGMLLHQAVPGFERWFGKRPQVTPQLRRMIVADIEAH
ncbi:shikimate dehydrogenase [Mesorhizobium sp. M1A.F.Ca.IN.020.06.1.1]|uniref:shikimate dehydrogenase n=1 Tax=unclassified Mesorhizobium TaxID=325217 RepID=UPI000FCACA63|nr:MULTISPECIES: shikimate dehydrogenase [unclassified Mesorhizobium]RUU97507.1 shikimate dehydrogenase [Mesorhizobium sp. M1A.F.Ca.IN.020.03.2.1]RUV87532.1 shikimate dehydrogenase [Mesorhizobium sp. M1A.F.Ca.IN.020.32.1.1]RUW10921.1 shikimate dehydrogenase [Mesorhizobium sp. M1A.F.Ca.IN.022.05.2.1]RUW21010.1 shikimate dehydrogenase [Mesorhizobium sp. M1A.F.Ca.IN.020.06.1.1]RWF83069.1 MAG: shikimate dehydrogenase [Mesorhizobium sp.]